MKICIIGASFAKAAYLPALRHIEGVTVAAIASARLDSARAAADAFGVEGAFDDWRAMLAQHRPDLVLIATPTDTHKEMAIAAMDGGAHVLCEKPTAMDAIEAKAMRDHAQKLGRVAVIDHELRFNPNRKRARELIQTGAIGVVRHVNIANVTGSATDPAGREKDNWWMLAERGGGRLGANGSHQVDLVRFWLGEVAAVSGQIFTVLPQRRDRQTGESWTATADDLTHFTLEMAGGALVQVFLSSVARSNMGNHTEIFGSEGTITLADSDEQLLLSRAGGPFEDITVADPNAELPGIGRGVWNVSVVALLREMIAAIRENRQPDAATFEDGWRNQMVLDAVKQSSAERRWVQITAG